MNQQTLNLQDFRGWLLAQIEQELDAFDRRTSGMPQRERDGWDAFTDAELDAVADALRPPQRPHPEGDRLAQDVLGRHGLTLDGLGADDRHTARIEALAAWADLLVLKSEAATDDTRSFPVRASVLTTRRQNLVAGGAPTGALSVEAMRQMQGLDLAAGKLTLSALFEQYCEAHRTEWKDWENRTRREYGPLQRVAVDLRGDLLLEQLTISFVKEFADRIKAEAKAKGRKDATVDKQLTLMGGVLRWAQQQGMVLDLTGPLKFSSEYDHYQAFDATELKTMFECEAMRSSRPGRPSQFWVPLLGFYTGARINEIASAKVEQVQREGETWGILLSPEGKRTGKNEESRRFVPLHRDMLAAGFLDFLDVLKAEGRTELFPDLPGDSRDGAGRSAGRDFQEFRRGLGIGHAEGEGRGTKTFHSFRSTLATAMQNAGVESDVRRAILGHAGRDVHERVYSQGTVPLRKQLEAIESITVPFTVPRWSDSPDQKYARENRRKRGARSKAKLGKP